MSQFDPTPTCPLLGEINGELDRLHHGLETTGVLHSPANVWSPDGFKKWRPIRRLSASKGRFVVVQSTTGASPAWLRLKLAPVLLRRRTFVRDGKAVSDWESKDYHPRWWPVVC
jgi:hypothetical protein